MNETVVENIVSKLEENSGYLTRDIPHFILWRDVANVLKDYVIINKNALINKIITYPPMKVDGITSILTRVSFSAQLNINGESNRYLEREAREESIGRIINDMENLSEENKNETEN